MTCVRALAIRFADLWAIDHHQMVDEIYAPGIHMESMANLDRVIEGRQQLHELEDRLADRIPEHRHELVRVLGDGHRAFLETTVMGPTTGHFAQAAVWWWIDGNGQVAHEVGWFDWDRRTTSARLSHGTVPALDCSSRGAAAWYESFATSLRDDWASDPMATIRRRCGEAVVAGFTGQEEIHGKAALEAAMARVAACLPSRHVEIRSVLGEGSVLAVLLVLGDGRRSTRGTVVLTLDGDDRIINARVYLDWAKATPVDAAGAEGLQVEER